MLVGDKHAFAIEADIQDRIDGWVLGRFRFWIVGSPVGDWEDAADLRGCARWLREFTVVPRDRFQPGLMNRPAVDVFQLVFDPVMAGTRCGIRSVPAIANAFSRFHISHIGMTSFERYDVLLMKDEDGNERCLWRKAEGTEIKEALFPPETMEDVAREFCERFEKEVGHR